MGLKDTDRFSRLHEQRLVIRETLERADNRLEAAPIPRGAARSAINDQVLRLLCHLRIEIVHEHPERCLLMPPFAADCGATRGSDGHVSAHT